MPALSYRVVPPDLPELRGLVVVADPHSTLAPGTSPFLKGGVVQVAVIAQQPDRATLLWAGRIGSELEGAFQTMSYRPMALSSARRAEQAIHADSMHEPCDNPAWRDADSLGGC
jgi:hypothetical protein